MDFWTRANFKKDIISYTSKSVWMHGYRCGRTDLDAAALWSHRKSPSLVRISMQPQCGLFRRSADPSADDTVAVRTHFSTVADGEDAVRMVL